MDCESERVHGEAAHEEGEDKNKSFRLQSSQKSWHELAESSAEKAVVQEQERPSLTIEE